MKFIHTICLSLILSASSFYTGISAQTADSYFLHTVSKGQSLYSIANMYDTTVDEIVRLNPGSDSQINTGQTLKIPQKQKTAGTDRSKSFHTIQPGETLYQLTVKYKVSAKDICAANPGLSASNFKIGQVIVIPAGSPTTETAQASSEQPATNKKEQSWKEMHKVERKETIFSISQEYGITQEELIAANPELRTQKLKKGMFLFIPYPKAETQAETPVTPATAPTNEELFSESQFERKSIHTIKAALLLPFMIGTDNKDEQQRMTEYYEGVLLALNELKAQNVSVDLYTYDTKGNTATLNTILNKGELKNMDIIIGGVRSANIKLLADYAAKNDIRLVVPFANKVVQVFNNPNIYQVNTPQSYLYSEAYEHFIRKFKGMNVIFLDTNNGDKDKNEFISGLKKELKDNRFTCSQMSINTQTTPEKLIAAMDTLSESIFIPLSGKNSALAQIFPALLQVRRSHSNIRMHLFGYPEWQTYTQEYLSNFYELDTYFYSSFYTNNLFPAAVQFSKNYRSWYGKEMANSYPKYGMLGYDTVYFFLKGLAQQGNKLEDNLDRISVTPIQTGFKFQRVNNWGGFINQKVFFVHFTKDYELIKMDFE
ncbi:LysM peptidoglycan-binding domain-containing protein [Phocaeicola barnesiae]